MSRELSTHYDTIVVGAGMSGLACASKLHESARYKTPGSLLVLEGRERIGGRINSVHVHGCRLDTGANWIHGIGTTDKPNPLMAILPNKRIRELSGSVAFRNPSEAEPTTAQGDANAVEDGWVDLGRANTSPRVTTSGRPTTDRVIPADAFGQMQPALWGMVGSLHELAVSMPAAEAERTTMLQAIHSTDAIRDVLEELPEEFHAAFRSMPAFIENMEAAPLVAQSAEQPQGQAGMALSEFAIDDFDGEQVFLQDGYIAVIEEVARPLIEAGVIRTGSEVKNIAWNDGPITVTTDATTYTADRVVCTLPLGVLQHSYASQSGATRLKSPLFTPELPAKYSKAITSLGFGTLDKIFLTYDAAWWEQDPYLSTLQPGIIKRPVLPERPPQSTTSPSHPIIPDSLWVFTDALTGLQLHADGHTSPGPRVLSLINLHSLSGTPALCAFVSCANATHVEGLSDAAAGALLHDALERAFGVAVPAPAAVHVTRWAADPFSRGSYSHMIAGRSETRHREILGEAIVNASGARLGFAGEHTSRDHFATVHGALLSGWREAERILEST